MGLDDKTTVFVYSSEQAERFYRKYPADRIMEWWDAVQEAHIAQLGSKIFWDENADFERLTNVYAGQDLELSHLLAYIDLFGPDSLTTDYRTRPRDKYSMDKDLLKSAEQRGFSVRFPQAIIEPTFYLPFKANLILEVPDWSGKVEKFGSLPNLVEELTETLAIVKQADPKAAETGQNDTHHEDRLAGAYNAARIKLALARIGLYQPSFALTQT